MMVVAIMGVLAAIAIPMSGTTVRYLKISGDARSLSNSVSVTKMRAAAKFTQARLFVDLAARQYYLQTCSAAGTSPCPTWATEGGTNSLSSTVSFGFGGAATPPPNTQSTIGQAPACLDNASPPAAIANSACIIFNSRGVPVDSTGAPTAANALYITDGSTIFGVTVAATGFSRTWQGTFASSPTWVQQ
jgi:Tfp pilus assembly protein FimT